MKSAISDLQFPETFKSLIILLSNIENIALLGAAALVNKDTQKKLTFSLQKNNLFTSNTP